MHSGAAALRRHALTLLEQGQFAAALAPLEQALALEPDVAEAHFHRGLALQNLGRLAEAETSYTACLRLAPGHALAYSNLGNVYSEQGRNDEALRCFDTAIDNDPSLVLAHYNRGRLLHATQQAEAALDSYSRCIELGADFAEAYSNCGLVLLELQQHEAALRCFATALELRPDFAEAYNNSGIVLLELRHYADAVRCFEQAAMLRPNYAEAYNNLGTAWAELKEFDAAGTAFRHAWQLRPAYGHAAGQAYRCALSACDWRTKKADEESLITMLAAGVADIPVFATLTLPDHAELPAAMLQQRAAEQYAHARYPTLAEPPLVTTARTTHDRLRIGYLSADFHEHATLHLLRGVLAAHDHTRFAIHGYSYGPFEDATTRAVARHFDVFRDLGHLSDRAAAAQIAADGIDILVDLKGYTAHTRLGITALRPAPVIVNWLGYPGTLGAPRLADYLIGDAVATPPEHAAHFSETLVLLPHCYQPNDRARRIGARPRRAALGLPEDGFVFCSFNQSYKFDPAMFDLWCRLLREVPGSVLWLLAPGAAAMANLQREAAARGVGAERLIFAPSLGQEEHLGRLQAADLALDTFPVTSHTTASDALWAGVPLVTLLGGSFVSRVAASLLHAVGLAELVTTSGEAYFALARDLALDPARLTALRQALAAGKATAPLFDTPRFTRNLERGYAAIWARHTQGKAKEEGVCLVVSEA